MRGVFLCLLLLLFAVVAARALNCQPCKLLEARKTHANDTHTRRDEEMKCLALVVLLAFLATLLAGSSEASFCPCNLSDKTEICGSNGVTYHNRCEFECTQRDYKKLGRTLNIQKLGKCSYE